MGRSKAEKPTPAPASVEAAPAEMLESLPLAETSAEPLTERVLDACRVAYCSRLNLRAAPGKGSAILEVLPEGTLVAVDSSQWIGDGIALWMPVEVDGLSGWVDARFLESYLPDDET